eukprot:s1452_g1.t1
MGEGPGGALGERSVMQIYRHAPTLDEITGGDLAAKNEAKDMVLLNDSLQSVAYNPAYRCPAWEHSTILASVM